jgi:LysW-gamma-L-lysine carboxypeptidase
MGIDAIPLLKELVEIESHSGQERQASEFLAAQMAGLGYAAQVDEVGNAVGVRECPDGEGCITDEIVLLGHIDTVPGDIPVRFENGLLYGRGTVDAKGPLATFVVAGAQTRLRAGTRLVVVGAVEEEVATSKGARHIAERHRPTGCIIGEPSGWDAVTLGYKGRMLLGYELEQPSSHTAGPARAVAEYAVAWWNGISDYAAAYNDGRDRVFDQLQPSLRRIETWGNGLADRVSAAVDVRLPPGFDVEGFQAAICRFAGEADLRVYEAIPAYRSDRGSALARAFSAALRGMGLRPRQKVKTGTSDMNVVGPAWGCPVVAYGPGDSNLGHTPDEHIVLDEYSRAIDVLTCVLEAL